MKPIFDEIKEYITLKSPKTKKKINPDLAEKRNKNGVDAGSSNEDKDSNEDENDREDSNNEGNSHNEDNSGSASNEDENDRRRSIEVVLNGTKCECKQLSEHELARLMDILVPITQSLGLDFIY